MEAVLNNFTEYEICFGNRFQIINHGHRTHQGQVAYNIRSSGFKISGISDTVYFGDSPNADLKTGTIFLFKLNSPTEPVILRRGIGSINYVKGEIKLNPINIIQTEVYRGTNLVEISSTPYSNDVIGLQDLYLQLDPFNTKVNMITDRIASGSDVSGTNYLVSSSYSNKLVRGTPIVSSSTSTDSTEAGARLISSRVSVTPTSQASSSSSYSY
jgi:hypothetical protein